MRGVKFEKQTFTGEEMAKMLEKTMEEHRRFINCAPSPEDMSFISPGNHNKWLILVALVALDAWENSKNPGIDGVYAKSENVDKLRAALRAIGVVK